jgi:hypothetical protein
MCGHAVMARSASDTLTPAAAATSPTVTLPGPGPHDYTIPLGSTSELYTTSHSAQLQQLRGVRV